MERQSTDMVPLGRDGFFKDPFFSSTWEEFDQERNLRMSKSQNSFWDKVDSDMAEFERCVSAMEADMDQRMAPLKPGLPSWALPQNHHKNWPKIMNDSSNRDGDTPGMMCNEKINDTKDKWEIVMDVQNFSPESLKVKVTGDIVTISGSQVRIIPNLISNKSCILPLFQTSSNVSDECNKSHSSQSFSRSYTMPSGCDPDSVSSNLNKQGQLMVSCPRPYYLQGPSAKALKM